MKKNNLIKISIFFLVGIFLISMVSAEISYCCEKTTYGAWCQNEEQEKCDSDFTIAPTSCEASSFCRQGCCYNSQEGECMENTPQKVCLEKNGVWSDNPNCEIPQCELGCCLIGDQAAFVTQTRCKRLSNLYGLENNFRTDIEGETQCILSATSDVEGACIFVKEFETTCKRTTKQECSELKATSEDDVDFYEGKLCSSEELGTNCAPTDKTTCVEGEDAVFFLDSCGNLANVYDSTKRDSKNYWAEIKDVSESCGYGTNGNPSSRTCGNCDYFLGTTCKEYERGTDAGAPNYGDNICRDLGCSYEGDRYEHGESWCAIVSDGEIIIGKDDTFNEKNLQEKNSPGSRYFRLLCYNGEVLNEPCADFRTEVCIQSNIGEYRVAACRANRWQDCASQGDTKDCENEAKRDCQWIEIEDIMSGCVPKYSPGYNFWEESETACEAANVQCSISYEQRLLQKEWDCEENCNCEKDSWAEKANKLCGYMGDCGIKDNFLGYEGFFEIKDLHKVGKLKKE